MGEDIHVTTTRTHRPIVALIPCGSEKADHACRAGDLYTGSTFRMALAAATSDAVEADHVFIVSAKHGLISPDQIIEPYDVKMGDAGSITADEIARQIVAAGIDDAEVYAFLPVAYFTVADKAFRSVDSYIADVYEGDRRGVGDHRHVCKIVTNS